MPRHKVPASLLSCSLLGLERLTAAGALGCCEAVVRTHRGHLEDSSTGFETKEMVEASASKRSIRRFVITEKPPTRVFSWLKVATIAFTFKTLLRHYAKRALTPRSLNVKLGPRCRSHKG